jgi:serine/threonine-protein kinase
VSSSDPRIGATVGGRYRLDERLGAGGMGVVYKGERRDDGRQVAVKFLSEEMAASRDLVKRFEREITAMRRLAHPHVVGVIDSGVEEGVPFLVMEFQSGRPLSRLLDRAALPGARAVGIARQLLAGLGAAHDVGVVHRDLKPDNIFVLAETRGDFIKILDFGLAKLAHGSGEATTQLTHTGHVLGTPGYMAPEQAKGAITDERTDIYAVGVILYQMVVGRRPFVAESPLAVLRMHADDPPVPPRKASPDGKVSVELEAAILRALEKPPGLRFQTAEEFAAALAATEEGRASSIPMVELSVPEVEAPGTRTRAGKRRAVKKAPQRRKKSRRWSWQIVVGAVVLAAAGAGAIGWTLLSRHGQSQVRQKLDSAVGGAKEALRQLTPSPKPADPPKPKRDDDDDDDGDATAPRDTPGVQLETASRASNSKKPLHLRDASRLLAAGKIDDSIQVLYQLRKQTPRSPDVALLLGHAYFAKLWRTDGLREYDEAIQLRAQARNDRSLLRNAVVALDDPTFKLARTLIRKRVGAAAIPELRRAEQSAKNPKVQKRAGRLAVELGNAAHPKAHR